MFLRSSLNQNKTYIIINRTSRSKIGSDKMIDDINRARKLESKLKFLIAERERTNKKLEFLMSQERYIKILLYG